MEINNNKLTQKELEVLEMVTIKNLTIKAILNRGQIKKSALYKHIRNLRIKGYLEKGGKTRMPAIMPLGKRYYRLHNLHFIITPYYFYERYKSYIGKSLFQDKWHIQINSKNIEFQTRSKASFDSQDIDECSRLCRYALEHALIRIEERIGCEIIKEGKLNVRLLNHHLAEVENGIAKLMKGKKLEIQDEDGKVWGIIDLSPTVPELETVDPILAIDDQKKLQKHFNDMRKPDTPSNSELLSYLTDVAKNQTIYNENIKLHLEVLTEINKAIKELRSGVVSASSLAHPIVEGFDTSFPSGEPLAPEALTIRTNIRDSFPDGWFTE